MQNGPLSPRLKHKFKLVVADIHTTATIANNDVIVKLEVDRELQDRIKGILDQT